MPRTSTPLCSVLAPLLGLLLACGPEGDTTATTAGEATSTGEPGTGTVATPTTGTGTGTEGPGPTTSTTGAPDSTGGDPDTEGPLTACVCPADSICVQFFDGTCGVTSQRCVPNPAGCVAGYPCAAACQPLCGGEGPDSCNNSDCPGEIDGAVHCFGS